MSEFKSMYEESVFIYLDVYSSCQERPASEFLMRIVKKDVKLSTYRDKFLPFQIEK